MNVLLWIIQLALALLYLSGGAYQSVPSSTSSRAS